MKIWVLFLFILIGGCAGVTPQQSLEGFDVQSRDSKCIRECSQTYSMCIANASASGGNRLVANDVIRACGGALRICAGTCPLR